MRNLLFVLLLLTGCAHRGDYLSFKVNDSDETFQLSAEYNPDKTEQVQEYLDEKLTTGNDASFENAEIDATMTLNDKTHFYIRSNPGELLIRFNKSENSKASYLKMKELSKGLKDVLTD
ncbi:hypothetical protein [Siphonobacter aquaeclarae]|uniref:Uncharacterized protein n=1 Tax=Siphonobacter aquaeclarae TaxID=563176 RepID=A0A1G9HUJ0_9BACT|nr:hypothetical protein [Siphonobacter aquaeclarae]SDL16384.1 hypothetical protein SAMN04488090_0204 [Siphonobacter aquaeclarae]